METLEKDKNTFGSIILPLSIIALAGVFTHSAQLDNVTNLAASNINGSNRQITTRLTEATQDAHIDLSSFTGDTSFLRTQPPATRTREDDEKDYANNNVHAIDDGNNESNGLLPAKSYVKLAA